MPATVTWHILDIKGRSIHASPSFQAFGLRWYLKFYPHGYDRDNYGYVAVALVLEDLANEESVFVQGDLYISSPAVAQSRKILELRRPSDDGWVQFSGQRMSYGQKRCMTSAELQDTYLATEDDLHIELDGFTIHRPVYQLINSRMFSQTLPKFVTLVRGKFVPHHGPQELATECEAPSQTVVGHQDREDGSAFSPFKSSPPYAPYATRGSFDEEDDRPLMRSARSPPGVSGDFTEDELEELRILERLKAKSPQGGYPVRAAHC
mmetsp:Transcript_553/g.1083  ORF Transcript_553/g.1083 Transcript_553/m.1083 type:complete len:264 (-) Transcript_553:161-952(-)